MYMNVRYFMKMFVSPDSQKFQLWDNEDEKIVFEGYLSDIDEDMEYLADAEVTSIDNNNGGEPLTLNIDIDKEEE